MAKKNEDSRDGTVEVLPDNFTPGEFEDNIRLANRVINDRFAHLYKLTKKRGSSKKTYDNLFDPGKIPLDMMEGMLHMWCEAYAKGDVVGALAIFDRLRKHLYPELKPREHEPPEDIEKVDAYAELRRELDLIQEHGGDLPVIEHDEK